MKFAMTGVAAAALLGMAACANTQSPTPVARPTDTGSMAFPAPAPAGNIGVASPRGADVGSMAYPTGRNGGTLQPGVNTPDTGSMAEPGRAQGNAGTRPLR